MDAERKTLGIEKQGTRVVGAMLNALDKIGQQNGLTLRDFTLTTDTQKDFEKYATTDALKLLVSDQAFVIRDSPQFSGTIYIRTEPAEGFYQLSQRHPDFVYDGELDSARTRALARKR